MHGVCMRYMKRPDVAQDALQESLVQVLNGIDKYQDRGKFKAWVKTVTVMKCLDLLRKERRFKYSDIDEIYSGLPTVTPTFDFNLEDIKAFFMELPDNYRVALNMFLIEGYSHKEIGAVLDISESSSRSLVSRGRKLIKERFKSAENAEEVRMSALRNVNLKII